MSEVKGRFGGTTGGLRPPTWTFAGHQSPSYQTYSDVKHTSRKPSIKSAILEGQTLDLSFPGHVYKQKIDFTKNLIFPSLAKSGPGDLNRWVSCRTSRDAGFDVPRKKKEIKVLVKISSDSESGRIRILSQIWGGRGVIWQSTND